MSVLCQSTTTHTGRVALTQRSRNLHVCNDNSFRLAGPNLCLIMKTLNFKSTGAGDLRIKLFFAADVLT